MVIKTCEFHYGRLNVLLTQSFVVLLTQSNVLIMTSVACAVGPSVTMFSIDFSFQNLVFWNLFEFSAAEITSKSISPHSESKSYQINSIKSCS